MAVLSAYFGCLAWFGTDGEGFGYRDADGRNGHIRLWDVATATVLATLDASTNTAGFVTSVAFGADDGLLAAGGTDGKIRLWRLRLPSG